MPDFRQSREYANYLKSIGWRIEKVRGVYVYLKKIPIMGWYAKIQRPTKKFLDRDIWELENKYKPFQIVIEPIDAVFLKGFNLSKNPNLPTKTLQIDLTQSKSKLLRSFSQKTRYNVKIAQKKGVIVERASARDFAKFWRDNFEKSRFPLPFFSQVKNIISLYRAFGSKSLILLAKKDGKIISGLFVIIYPPLAYYLFAASNDAGRKNFAPTFLIWRAMQEAKKRGCTIFDFDGIYDERFPIETWKGFTKFKKGFGGKEKEYPDAFEKTNSWFRI